MYRSGLNALKVQLLSLPGYSYVMLATNSVPTADSVSCPIPQLQPINETQSESEMEIREMLRWKQIDGRKLIESKDILVRKKVLTNMSK